MAVLDRQELSTQPPRPLTDAELAARWQAAYPEARGAGREDGVSGNVIYDHPPDSRIGPVPQRLTVAEIEAENARRQAARDAMTPQQRAVMDGITEAVRAELGRHRA